MARLTTRYRRVARSDRGTRHVLSLSCRLETGEIQPLVEKSRRGLFRRIESTPRAEAAVVAFALECPA